MLQDRQDELLAVDADAASGPSLALTVAAESAATVGLTDVCEALYPGVSAQVDRFRIRPFDWALTRRVVAMTAACTGRWEEAEAQFADALAQAEALPNRLELPQVMHWHGVMLLDRGRTGDKERARGLLDVAREGYLDLGMPVRAALVEERLRTG